jgi:hypothetical protein
MVLTNMARAIIPSLAFDFVEISLNLVTGARNVKFISPLNPKRLELEAYNSAPTSVDVIKTWSITSIVLHIFMA